MTDGILIKPPELRMRAQTVRENAKSIYMAIEAVDAAINALGPSRFKGESADTIRAKYASMKERVFSFKPMMERFASSLDVTADRFEAADRASQSQV